MPKRHGLLVPSSSSSLARLPAKAQNPIAHDVDDVGGNQPEHIALHSVDPRMNLPMHRLKPWNHKKAWEPTLTRLYTGHLSAAQK